MGRQDSDKEKRGIKRRAAGVILAVALAAAAGTALWSAQKEELAISDEAVAWEKDLKDLAGENTGIKIPGYTQISIKSGETTWPVTLANPKENNCYFQYAVLIGDSKTPVYESELIEPGKAIRSFTVKESLAAGAYEVHLRITAYAMDGSLTQLNGADVKATLQVQA